MHEARSFENLTGIAVDARCLTNGGILPPRSAFEKPPSPKAKTLIVPFNFDSEFQDNLGRTNPLDSGPIDSRAGVTVQIRGIHEPAGLIFVHPNLAGNGHHGKLRHAVVSHPCVVGDWLESRGVVVSILQDEETWQATRRKTCRLQMLAHFAVADVAFLAGTPEFAETVQELFVRKRLRQSRRLAAFGSANENSSSKYGTGLKPWVIFLEGNPYRLSLEIIDSNALHGVAGYKAIASNVGLPLDAKDRISRTGRNAEISRMDEMYFERPEDFDGYALGDLHVSDIIEKDEALWRHIWGTLGIEKHFKGTKLTIGSSVAGIVKARVAKLLGFEDANDKNLEAMTTGTHNAAFLSKFAKEKNPIALLSKVDGGRCRTANPLLTSMNGVLCDIDISGAYASAMSAVPLILGKARMHGFGNCRDGKPDLKDCISVMEMKRRYSLVDRHWFARIQTKEPYTFDTDVIPSWIDWRHIAERKTDSEAQGMDVLQDADSGEMRYFSREVHAGTLTSDLLHVIETTFSPKQFAEWCEKTVVRSVIYVDAKDRLSVEEFTEHIRNETLPEYGWTSVTLGELVSDLARAQRMQHAKKTPLNELFKLLSNTVYGVSVSRHFASSSVIAGSNVTACVRAFMYLCEKGLCLVGSITDGQLFDLNRVLYRKRNKNVNDVALGTHAYRANKKTLNAAGEAKFAPLLGSKITAKWNGKTAEISIEHEDGTTEVLTGKDAEKRINEAAFQHLLSLWPKCPMLTEETNVVAGLNPNGTVKYERQTGLFRFEMKSFVQHAAFHGSANYQHETFDPSKPPEIKMRSFEGKRKHLAFSLDDSGGLTMLDFYEDPRTDEEIEKFPYANPHQPAAWLMRSIKENPHAVPFFPPFCKTRILLPGIFQTQRKYRSSSCLIGPGDSIFVLGKPRLVSLTAFTFQTRRQYDSWKRIHTYLNNKHGVSFELWFMNPDGTTVDYARMLQAIDEAICSGVVNPISHFDSTIGKRGSSDTVKRFHEAKKAIKKHLDSRVSSMDEDELPIVHDEDTSGFSGAEWQ